MADGAPGGQIQEFLLVLKRRRWQIVLPALFVFVFGTAFAVIIPKKYIVDTKILVKDSRNPFDDGFKGRNQSATGREIENVEEHIIHYSRIRRIVGKELIDQWPEYDRGSLETRREILDGIMKNLTVEKVAKSKEVGGTYLEITFKDGNGKRAVAFLNRLNTGWIEDIIQSDLDDLLLEQEVLGQSKKEKQKRFRDAETKYVDQCKALGANPALPPDARDRSGNAFNSGNYDALRDVRAKKDDVSARLDEARQTLKQRKLQLDAEPDTIKVPELREGLDLQAEILTAEKEIESLKLALSEITALHSDYEVILAKIETLELAIDELTDRQVEAREVMRSERNPYKDELRKEVDDLAVQITNLEGEAEWLIEKEKEYERKTTRQAADFGLLSTLWTEREAALKELKLVEAELGKKDQSIRLYQGTVDRVYEVVMPPGILNAEQEPSAMLLIAFALFAGLALGMGVALVSEYARNSYRTVSELSAVMAVPVLGAVGGIVTRAQRRTVRGRRLVVGTSSAIILLGISWITFTWYDEERRQSLPVAVVQAIEGFQRALE